MEVIVIAGSTKDESFIQRITTSLESFNIKAKVFFASAHKEPTRVLEILESYKEKKVICVTVAGMSNALSGFVAANSNFITIGCPPFKDKQDMMVNIHSTLQMPSKVPVLTILNPENCALAISRMVNL